MVDWIFDCFKTYRPLCIPHMYTQQQSTIVDKDCILCCSIHMYCSLSVYNHRLYMGLLVLWCNLQIETRGQTYVLLYVLLHGVTMVYVFCLPMGVVVYNRPLVLETPPFGNRKFSIQQAPLCWNNDPPPRLALPQCSIMITIGSM